MKVLVPVDGSDCSFRAFEFATEFVTRFEGTIHVVHITDREDETTEELLERVDAELSEAGLVANPEVVTDSLVAYPRYGNQVGKDILHLVDERDYDHVVMGSHGSDLVSRAILGSAAETVVRAGETPCTVIP